MDNDQKKTPLNSYFEDALLRAEADDFDLQSFITGLDAYGILPEEVSSLITDLHAVSSSEQGATYNPQELEEIKKQRVTLVKKLGTALMPEGTSALPQIRESSEIQSALPVAPISEGRRQAQEDIGEYVRYQHSQKSAYLKGNVNWRRKVAQDFVTRLRKERLYGGGTDSEKNAIIAIGKALENPIYAKTAEEAAQKLAEKIVESFSYNELFAQNREKARKIIAEKAAEVSAEPGRQTILDEIIDIPTTHAVEAVIQNRTLEDVHEVINRFDSVSKKTDGSSIAELESATNTARIYASVTAKSEASTAPDPATVKEFTSSIYAIQHNEVHKKKLMEKVAVDDFGREIVEKGQASEFISRSEKYSSKNLKNIVTEYVAPAYTPDERVFDYVAAEIRHNPAGVATPERYVKAIQPQPMHLEFHMPELSWVLRPGPKNPGMTVASAAIKKGLSERAKAMGTQALLKLGVSAGSKIMLVGAPVVGWALLIGTAFSGTIKNITVSATTKFFSGGLGSIRAANGAFSEFIQNALGTKYEDPLAPNGWLLALGLAVLPFLLAFLFTTATIQVQRSSFLPIGVEGGLAEDFAQPFNISITAVPSAGANGIPNAITYTITISSLDGGPVTVNTLTISFSVFGGKGKPPETLSIEGSQIVGGTYTFTVPMGAAYNDSLISAIATANVDTPSQSGVDGSASVSTIIGNPPSGCFVFGGAGQADAYGHTSSAWDDQSKVMAAISILAASPDYLLRYVCVDGPVTLYRVKSDYGGGSTLGANMVFLYDVCFISSQACMTYTLAHESGHIVNNRSASPMGQFHNQGISNREGFIRTYPNCRTESEDFAETIGDYVVWKYYPFRARSRNPACDTDSPGGNLNYPQEYPLHYQFAKDLFKMEY